MTYPLISPSFPTTQNSDVGAGAVYSIAAAVGVNNRTSFVGAPAAGLNFYISLATIQLIDPGLCNGRLDLIIEGATSLTKFIEYSPFLSGKFQLNALQLWLFGNPLGIPTNEGLNLNVTSTSTVVFTCIFRARIFYSLA